MKQRKDDKNLINAMASTASNGYSTPSTTIDPKNFWNPYFPIYPTATDTTTNNQVMWQTFYICPACKANILIPLSTKYNYCPYCSASLTPEKSELDDIRRAIHDIQGMLAEYLEKKHNNKAKVI